MEEKTKNPSLAVIFSFVFPGAGQLYNGQIAKGLLIIFLSVASMLVLLAGAVLIAFWIKGRILFQRQLILGFILSSLGMVFISIFAI